MSLSFPLQVEIIKWIETAETMQAVKEYEISKPTHYIFRQSLGDSYPVFKLKLKYNKPNWASIVSDHGSIRILPLEQSFSTRI